MKKYSISIDVGGTNIKIGIISSRGSILSKSFLETRKYQKKKVTGLIDAVCREIDELLKSNRLSQKNILGIGIGLPGLVDPEKGVVYFLPNISGWRNVALKEILQKKTGLPVYIDNDVNLMALGEWKFGAGKGFKNLLCMTLGTGVGGGLILNNELYRGESFVAGEIGHLPLNEKGPKCNCGSEGCFEQYVGNAQITAKAAKIFKNRNIRLEDVYDLARKGNIRAVQFWEEVGTHVGNALVGIVNILNPRLIIIGGGVSASFRYLRPAIARTIKARAMKTQAQMVKVVKAKLGNDAAVIGAHVLVQQHNTGRTPSK